MPPFLAQPAWEAWAWITREGQCPRVYGFPLFCQTNGGGYMVLFIGGRQKGNRKTEPASLFRVTLHPEEALVCFGKFLAQHKSQARSFFACRTKSSDAFLQSDLLQNIRLYAYACIYNTDLCNTIHHRALNGDRISRVTKFNGITDEVAEQHLEHRPIRPCRQGKRQLIFQPDLFFRCLSGKKADGVARDLLQ